MRRAERFTDAPVLGLLEGFLQGRRENSLSEAPAVDLGDGVGGHGTADPGAGRRTLGHWGDAVWRVLAGWGEGGVTGPAQTVLC